MADRKHIECRGYQFDRFSEFCAENGHRKFRVVSSLIDLFNKSPEIRELVYQNMNNINFRRTKTKKAPSQEEAVLETDKR